eukprot:381645-Rhodomonas_salina.1
MDNDATAVENKAEAKRAKYEPAKSILEDHLRRGRGPQWTVTHMLFVVGWKLSLNEERWYSNLEHLGIPERKRKGVITASVNAALRSFRSMTNARMGETQAVKEGSVPTQLHASNSEGEDRAVGRMTGSGWPAGARKQGGAGKAPPRQQ